MAQKKFTRIHKMYTAGILLVCGLLLTSVDDCENMYLAEQDQASRIAQEQARRAEQERAAREWRERGGNSPNNASQRQSSVQSQTQGQSTSSQSRSAGNQEQSSQRAPAGNQPAAASAGTAGSSVNSGTGAATATAGTGATAATDATAGAGATASTAGAANLSGITGKEWKLSEVRLPGKTLIVDRNKLNADKMGDFFTLNIDDSRVSGKAAPNRYTAPYQAGPNNTLTIQPPAGTLMALIYDPERIREQDYFLYLTRVKSWKLNQGKLELYTTDANNKEVVLVYGN